MADSCKTKGTCPSSKGPSCGTAAKQAAAVQDMVIKSSLGKIKNKILVMSGKGGVGKSTVSTNLALGLAKKGYKVGLIDVDLHGPDICRMLNLSHSLRNAEIKNGRVPPMQYGDSLKVISLEYMMENRDDPIIWRGPLKIQAIRQFISDIDWGELDYLIFDAPPGTGDEPLTVANTIKDAQALVVTTPQEVALADVRKSINFCKHVNMKVLGLVENMSGFVCPHCSGEVEIFRSGGGEKTARDFGIPFLGRIPMDPKVVLAGDTGTPYLSSDADSPATRAFDGIVNAVLAAMPLASGVQAPAAACEAGNAGSSACGCSG